MIKENLEYAGIVIVPIFILLLMVPKQLPDFGISSIELYTRLSEENLLLKLLFEDPDIYVGNMGRAFKKKNQSEDRKLNSKKL